MTLLWILVGTVVAGVGSVWLAALLGFAMLARFTQHMLSLAAGALLATAFIKNILRFQTSPFRGIEFIWERGNLFQIRSERGVD